MITLLQKFSSPCFGFLVWLVHLSPNPSNLFLSFYCLSSPSWSEDRSLRSHRSTYLAASWKEIKAVIFSVLSFSFQSYSTLCSLQRENHDFLETWSYLVTSWHQDLYDVENWKRPKPVTKEEIQSVAVIIAGILYDYMKMKLFIYFLFFYFVLTSFFGKIQSCFPQKCQEAHQKIQAFPV